MRTHIRFAAIVTLAWAMLSGHLLRAQNPAGGLATWIPDIKFATGRNIAPYLEGWIRNPDGSADFVFGYFNRNTAEELAIPAGADNSVMPGGPDRGQPTYFLPRRQPRIFRLRVPADWGPDKALTWSITANGRTEKVVARLLPAEEITEHMIVANGNNTLQFGEGEGDRNKPPTITVQPIETASAAAPLVLTAAVTDDALPKPRLMVPEKKVPTSPAEARFQSQRNSSGRRNNAGLRVRWVEYRGPAKVTFEPDTISLAKATGGRAVTTARFAEPGTYSLIAMASDGRLMSRADVTVTVK